MKTARDKSGNGTLPKISMSAPEQEVPALQGFRDSLKKTF